MKPESVNPAKTVASTLDSVANCKFRSLARHNWLRVAACGLIGLLIAFGIDWYMAWQNPTARWLGPLLVWSTTGFLTWRALKFFQKGPDKTAAAEALDRSQEGSLDRWTTFAALQENGAGATGSASMTKAFVREMAPQCQYFDPTTVEPIPLPRRTLIGMIAGAAFLLGFLGFYYKEGSPRLLARFILPWAELPLTQLEESSNPPRVLLRGNDLEIAVNVAGKRPASVWLEIDDNQEADSEAHGDPERTISSPSTSPKFKLEQLDQPLRYRFRAGDAVTAWQSVRVVDRPRISRVTVTLTDPPYSKRPPRVWNRLPSGIKAIQGSSLSLQFESDQSLASARLELDTTVKRTITLKPSENQFSYQAELSNTFKFRPSFQSVDGFANSPLPFSSIEVIADQAPKVKLTNESESRILSPQHDLEIAFEARDDVGIAKAEAVFSIIDQNGTTREQAIPIDLRDRLGKTEVSMKETIKLSDLQLSPRDKVAYTVRVSDNSQQESSAETKGETRESGAPGMPPNTMTKRSLKIGGGSAQSKPLQVSFANTEMLNSIEPKKKTLLAIEEAFQLVQKLTENALGKTRAAKAPQRIPGQSIDTKRLYEAVAGARKDIDTATKSVTQISGQALGTPYAFLCLQLQTVVRSYLKPANSKLIDSTRSRLTELPPREVHREQADRLLSGALAKLKSLESNVSQIRSKVDTEIAVAKMLTMIVAQVEDIPVLLSEGGAGTPYQRTPGEVDRAQAEAALKRLEAKKELYQKTAELLRQHPELWERYMDKSNSESRIFRDELESLAQRHDVVRALTANEGKGIHSEAEIRNLITAHQKKIGSSLLRSLNKAKTWLETSPEEKPAWLEGLESVTFGTLKSSAAESPTINELEATARLNNQGLDLTIRELIEASSLSPDAQRSSALRIGELKQARSESGLVAALIHALENRSWREAALLEQAHIAHHTQQLAGKIELAGVRLNSLAPEVEALGKALNSKMQDQLLPSLGRSVENLQDSRINGARQSQAEAAECFALCVSALDQFVMAAIREKDKAPAVAKAGVAGAPKITASTLEELERKLEEEKDISESFGIPCCRPTNFQVMSDWERVAKSNSGNPPPPMASNPGQKPKQQSGKGQPPRQDSKPGQQAPKGAGKSEANEPGKLASTENSDNMNRSTGKPSQDAEAHREKNRETGEGEPGKKRSELKVAELTEETSASKISEIARAAALRQAKDLANLLSQGQAAASTNTSTGIAQEDGSAHGLSDSTVDIRNTSTSSRDWNRLSSQLRREILQEKANTMPEQYRDAIEAYFRSLSNWEGDQTK